MGAARRQPRSQALDRRLVHRLLAGPICAQRLGQKHRQRLDGRKASFSMRRQHRLDLVEQFRPRQQIEKRIRVTVMDQALLGVQVDVLTPKALPEKVRARVLGEAVPV